MKYWFAVDENKHSPSWNSLLVHEDESQGEGAMVRVGTTVAGHTSWKMEVGVGAIIVPVRVGTTLSPEQSYCR